MKYTRLHTGTDGQSHFEDAILEANSFPTTSVIFGDATDIHEITWHNPPAPQFVIMLQGAMEIEVGDGTKRIFHAGDILLAENTSGQGHITRAASTGTRTYLVVPIALRTNEQPQPTDVRDLKKLSPAPGVNVTIDEMIAKRFKSGDV